MNTTARKYNKRVEIWGTETVSDGFGGTLTQEVPLTTAWMNIITNLGNRYTDLGITDLLNTYRFEMRSRELTKDNFFNYRGEKYVIQSIENTGLMDNELIVLATRQ